MKNERLMIGRMENFKRPILCSIMLTFLKNSLECETQLIFVSVGQLFKKKIFVDQLQPCSRVSYIIKY